LDPSKWNPSNASYFDGQPPVRVPVVEGCTDNTIPNPDPEETFDNVTYQIYGPEGPKENPKWPMSGFVVNYERATFSVSAAGQIMESYRSSQVPVISALAQNYAVSDAWFCSVPSQTLPNRSFFHTGTSNGNVDNGAPADPYDWNVPSIFNLFDAVGGSWAVYSNAILAPPLTRTFLPGLWDRSYHDHFQDFRAFQEACANNSLPPYSFIEPRFIFDPNDLHPPHDISRGEQFLYQIWEAVSESPGRNNILLIITYDEHGGCYDHVLPPLGAANPDSAGKSGSEGCLFDRFGVRVPTVVVSPFVQAGTVFRSDTATPYDHTSVLATLRDWLPISSNQMLPSRRIAVAPNLGQVLTLTEPRKDKPSITAPRTTVEETATAQTETPNDLQKTLVAGTARRFDTDASTVLEQIRTRRDAQDFFNRTGSMGGL
jgi:phospholipase C